LFVGLLESLCSPLPSSSNNKIQPDQDVDQKVNQSVDKDSVEIEPQEFGVVQQENQDFDEEMDDDCELGEIKDEDDEIKDEDDQDYGKVIKKESQSIEEKKKYQPNPKVVEKVKEESKIDDFEKPPLLDNIALSRTVCLPAKLIRTVYAETDGKPNKLEKLISVIKVFKIIVVLLYHMLFVQVNCKDNETLAETFSDRITEVLSVISDLETVKLGKCVVYMTNSVVTKFLCRYS